ncbi:MAG: RnfH family protein [Woeseiaceae bacterium]
MDQLAAKRLTIEIAYATAEQQLIKTFDVTPGTRVREAIITSEFDSSFPDIDLANCPVGIWGRVVGEDQVLSEGDRIEIYRTLAHNPREARRRLARDGLTMGGAASDEQGDG